MYINFLKKLCLLLTHEAFNCNQVSWQLLSSFYINLIVIFITTFLMLNNFYNKSLNNLLFTLWVIPYPTFGTPQQIILAFTLRSEVFRYLSLTFQTFVAKLFIFRNSFSPRLRVQVVEWIANRFYQVLNIACIIYNIILVL